MKEVNFPRRTLRNSYGIIAVEPHMKDIPAYEDTETMTLNEMREYAKKNGGTIMQQDDAWLPPFVLIKYNESGEIVNVS